MLEEFGTSAENSVTPTPDYSQNIGSSDVNTPSPSINPVETQPIKQEQQIENQPIQQQQNVEQDQDNQNTPRTAAQFYRNISSQGSSEVNPQPNIQMGVETEKSTSWLTLQAGMQFEQFGEVEAWQPNISEEDKCTYYSNNGIVAVIDEQGQFKVAPKTSDRIKEIRNKGYTPGSIWVPLSNKEVPVDPQIRQTWEQMQEEARQQNLEARTREYLNRYLLVAQERGIEKEIKGEWLTMDGLEIESYIIGREKIEPNTDGYNTPLKRLEGVGTYTSNNGVVAIIDGEGRLRVSPRSREISEAIKEAGYTPGNIWVPLSNGELPVDPQVKEKWMGMVERTRQQNLEARTREHLNRYLLVAQERGIREIGGQWLPMDGVETESFVDGISKTEPNTDGYNMPIGRLELVGTYAINNGVVAIVDHEGKMKVAPANKETYKAIRDAGYTPGNIWVPLSNKEIPTDPQVQQAWEQMRGRRVF